MCGQGRDEVKRPLVLFDIDGTLLASGGAGRRAILATITRFCDDSTGLNTVRFDGKTDPQIVVELFEAAGVPNPEEPERVSTVLDHYVSALEQELAHPARAAQLMPGIRELLNRFDDGAEPVLGLLTGNVRTGATLKLRSAKLDCERFRVGAFGSDHRDRSELPAIASQRAMPIFGYAPRGEDIVIIGDTPADMTCGLALGARAIGVGTGAYALEELEAAGAWAVFPDLSDVDRVWECICH
jgi:phosphoglycolate phosphatase-like HAD superfamily hydrolase